MFDRMGLSLPLARGFPRVRPVVVGRFTDHKERGTLNTSPLSRHIAHYAAFIAVFLAAPSSALDPSPADLKAYSKLLPGAQQGEDQLRPADQLADNSIIPEAYVIGGGDVFQISVVESPSIQYTGTVNENCDVYIPELGIIKIGKTNLVRAKQIIADFVSSKLKRKFDVYVSLVKTKMAVVSVSGAVSSPGTYRLSGTFRLFDAIKAANNGVVPSFNEYNYREIECRNRDSSRVFDLFKYLLAADLSENPYLYPGDNIRFSLARRRAMISGSIRAQVSGLVPIRQDERLADFLSLFSLDASADSDHIILQRTNPDRTTYTKIVSIRDSGSFTLRDRDLVIVSEKENYPQVATVSLRGEIVRPGVYPLVRNVTKAADVIGQAGGATTLGNPDRAYVIRRKKMFGDERQGNATPKAVVSASLLDNSVRPEINSGLIRMSISNDFSVLRFSDNDSGIMLEPDDEIVVPKKEYSVYVSGSVRRPGAYPYEAGCTKDHYIGLAGGYSSKADRTNSVVVTYYGPVRQVRESGVLEEGDVIVVPDSQQYKFLTLVAIPILSAIAVTISTILAIYTSVNR